MSFYDESRSAWQNYRQAGAKFQQDLYAWGSQTFANSYAQGGHAWKIFSPAGVKGYSRTTIGSPEYNRRLEELRMASERGSSARKNIHKALREARAGKLGTKASSGFVGKAFGATVGAALIGLPMLTTEGGLKEKGVATAAGAVGYLAFHSAGLAGAYMGAAIGSIVPVIGNVIGGVIGYGVGALAGSSAVESMVHGGFNVFDRAAMKNRSLRKNSWAGDISAFNTQQSYTMRASSLQMMNSGLLTARSGLGHEGVMLHQ